MHLAFASSRIISPTFGAMIMPLYAGAARAVGNALHVNPEPVVVPCHRVVNASGKLAPWFAFGGLNAQKRLLES